LPKGPRPGKFYLTSTGTFCCRGIVHVLLGRDSLKRLLGVARTWPPTRRDQRWVVPHAPWHQCHHV
ncbi:hypothetical protein SK128_007949, partial [Halocaridina rubra]